jgi:myo-inositol-1(or 4)-monophosphatase
MHPTGFAEFAVDLARRGGAHLMSLLPAAAESKQIRFKGPTDLVTRADGEVETLIAERVRAAYPDHGFLAEEGTVREGGVYRWIVDPLDGTTNFAHGLPWFAVSIALEYRGEVSLGVVYHPPLDEIFIAERGRGAWAAVRGDTFTRLAVSPTEELSAALLSTGLPGPERRSRHLRTIPQFIEHTREVRIMGSAAINLAYVAAGRLDGFWEPGLNLWDIAAGILLVEEAGGQVTDLRGGPSRGGDVLASNGRIHAAILGMLATGA